MAMSTGIVPSTRGLVALASPCSNETFGFQPRAVSLLTSSNLRGLPSGLDKSVALHAQRMRQLLRRIWI